MMSKQIRLLQTFEAFEIDDFETVSRVPSCSTSTCRSGTIIER